MYVALIAKSSSNYNWKNLALKLKMHHNKLKNVNLGVLIDNLLLPLCSENEKSLKVKWTNCIDTKTFENMAENA